MQGKRTDLAVEAKELWEESAHRTTELPGVKAREVQRQGCAVTTVDVLDAVGSAALGKPVGRYVTVTLPEGLGSESFEHAAECIGLELRRMLPEAARRKTVLVAGLGNRAVTPDALGPRALEHILVTRHLRQASPKIFSAFSPVCTLCPGVLGTTGVESAEILRGAALAVEPSCVIVIDALVSRRVHRLCRTVQLSDTGLIPGSGVGNHRQAIDEALLRVPVLSVGVPTVIDAATLAADLLEEAGFPGAVENTEALRTGMIVAEKEIDARVETLARLVGYGIDLGLHPGLTPRDVTAFLG